MQQVQQQAQQQHNAFEQRNRRTLSLFVESASPMPLPKRETALLWVPANTLMCRCQAFPP